MVLTGPPEGGSLIILQRIFALGEAISHLLPGSAPSIGRSSHLPQLGFSPQRLCLEEWLFTFQGSFSISTQIIRLNSAFVVNYVFLDESGCNTDMTNSLGGSRAVDSAPFTKPKSTDSAPFTKPKSTTILSSIQLDGTLRYTTFSGGTTVEKFKQYLENHLLPYLNSDSVLIMDHMRSHHAKAVKALLDQMKVHYSYLPPYSPDLNPIEKLWSKVKALLRKFKARSEDRLSDTIRDAFCAVTASDCLGWFRSCGYML